IGADQTLRRARLLDLGDERKAARGVAPLDRGEEAARRGRSPGFRLDGAERARALRRRDLGALVGLDLGQDIGHWLDLLKLRIRRSAARARPRLRRCRSTS